MGRNGAVARAILALCLFALSACTTQTVAEEDPLVVFLVRHAEKTRGGSDPELTPAGRDRAAALARYLGDSGLQFVHTSDYVRTRETAAPVAAKLGLSVELYDPRDLPALIERVRSAGGRHLVVGHSNTTPEAVELLGGEASGIAESEYDRLYIIVRRRNGEVSTVLVRYGAP